MVLELGIKIKMSPDAVVTWIHGPWYSTAIYEGMATNHGMSREDVDASLAELRREGLIQTRPDGEPEMCIDTRRGGYLKAEFCRAADIPSPPDLGAGARLVRMFQPRIPADPWPSGRGQEQELKVSISRVISDEDLSAWRAQLREAWREAEPCLIHPEQSTEGG